MPSRRTAQRLAWLLTTLWLAYWALLFALTHMPLPPGVLPKFRGSDKVAHFVAYLGLTLLGGVAWFWRHRLRTVADPPAQKLIRLRVLAVWLGVYVAYGAVDEWLQQFVNRSTSVFDWLADVAGVAVATGLLALILRRGPR